MLVVVPTPLNVSYQRSQQAEGWWSIHKVYPNRSPAVRGLSHCSQLCGWFCIQFVVFLTLQYDTLVVGTQTSDCSLRETVLLVRH